MKGSDKFCMRQIEDSLLVLKNGSCEHTTNDLPTFSPQKRNLEIGPSECLLPIFGTKNRILKNWSCERAFRLHKKNVEQFWFFTSNSTSPLLRNVSFRIPVLRNVVRHCYRKHLPHFILSWPCTMMLTTSQCCYFVTIQQVILLATDYNHDSNPKFITILLGKVFGSMCLGMQSDIVIVNIFHISYSVDHAQWCWPLPNATVL